MDVCFNCGCNLEGEIAVQHMDCDGWLCIKCVVSLLGGSPMDS